MCGVIVKRDGKKSSVSQADIAETSPPSASFVPIIIALPISTHGEDQSNDI
jgi:hypothetical protein